MWKGDKESMENTKEKTEEKEVNVEIVPLAERKDCISEETEGEKAKKIFDLLSKVDVKQYVKKKNGFDYLPWASAFGILFQYYPDTSFRIIEYSQDGCEIIPDSVKTVRKVSEDGTKISSQVRMRGMPYRTVAGGLEMTSEMTINGITRRMSLPILNFANKPVAVADTMLINKTQWRCLVKNAALFGLGIILYVGEDLPSEDVVEETKTQKKKIEPVKAKAKLKKEAKAEEKSDILEYKIKGDFNGNKNSVGTKMSNLILNAKSTKASKEALTWYSENGLEEDSTSAKELLKMLEEGKIKFPDSAK